MRDCAAPPRVGSEGALHGVEKTRAEAATLSAAAATAAGVVLGSGRLQPDLVLVMGLATGLATGLALGPALGTDVARGVIRERWQRTGPDVPRA